MNRFYHLDRMRQQDTLSGLEKFHSGGALRNTYSASSVCLLMYIFYLWGFSYVIHLILTFFVFEYPPQIMVTQNIVVRSFGVTILNGEFFPNNSPPAVCLFSQVLFFFFQVSFLHLRNRSNLPVSVGGL